MKLFCLALAFVLTSLPALAFDPCFAARVTSQLARGESLRAQAAAISDDPQQQALQVLSPTGPMIAAAAIAQAAAQASLQACLDSAAHGP